MTWLSAYPGGTPSEHPTEAAAEAHAAWIVSSGKASVAQTETWEVR